MKYITLISIALITISCNTTKTLTDLQDKALLKEYQRVQDYDYHLSLNPDGTFNILTYYGETIPNIPIDSLQRTIELDNL